MEKIKKLIIEWFTSRELINSYLEPTIDELINDAIEKSKKLDKIYKQLG